MVRINQESKLKSKLKPYTSNLFYFNKEYDNANESLEEYGLVKFISIKSLWKSNIIFLLKYRIELPIIIFWFKNNFYNM
jgi:hypothetical protein